MCCQQWAGVAKEAELGSALPTGNGASAWNAVQRYFESVWVSCGVDALQLCLLQSDIALLMVS